MSYRFLVFFYFYYLGFFYTLITSLYEDLSFSGFQRSLLMGIVPVLSFFANILWGRIADRWHCRLKLLLYFSLIGAISQFFLLNTPDFYKLFMLSVITGIFIFPMIPLNDALVISYNLNSSTTYGSIRVWGTVSFMMANFSLILIYRFAPYLKDYLLYSMPLSLLFMTVPLILIKEFHFPSKHSENKKNEKKHFLSPFIIIFLAAVFFQNMGFSGKFTFFSAHLKIIGFTPAQIAFCWGLAPIGEIIIFLYAEKIIKRYGYCFLLTFGILSAIVRWLILIVSTDFTVIAISQVFYSFAFGGYYAASMALLKDKIPESLRNTGQGVFAACVNLAMVAGNFFGGIMFDSFSSRHVFIFSTLSAIMAFIFAFRLYRLSDRD